MGEGGRGRVSVNGVWVREGEGGRGRVSECEWSMGEGG